MAASDEPPALFAGFVDAAGRLYDLTFRSVRRRLFDRAGDLALGPDEGVGATARLTLTVDGEQGGRPVPLLRPTEGEATATSRRIVFLAEPGAGRTPDAPTRFNVSISVPLTAVQHLLLEAGGREVLLIPRAGLGPPRREGAEVAVTLRARIPWRPEATGTFALRLRPADVAEALLAGSD